MLLFRFLGTSAERGRNRNRRLKIVLRRTDSQSGLGLGQISNEASRGPCYRLQMGFGVFIHRSDSIYDDSPAEQYQFPGQYLGRVQACVGDWIVYYEPRKVAATRGYFAVSKVERVIHREGDCAWQGFRAATSPVPEMAP